MKRKNIRLVNEKPKRSVLIENLDTVFSLYIRYRDNWTCQRCGCPHVENDGNLHNSHFWGRGNFSTRWDPDNCDSLCGKVLNLNGKLQLISCHGIWENDKNGEYRDFKLKQLGDEKYDVMLVRKNSSPHFSRTDLMLLLKDWQKKLITEKTRFKEENGDLC